MNVKKWLEQIIPRKASGNQAPTQTPNEHIQCLTEAYQIAKQAAAYIRELSDTVVNINRAMQVESRLGMIEALAESKARTFEAIEMQRSFQRTVGAWLVVALPRMAQCISLEDFCNAIHVDLDVAKALIRKRNGQGQTDPLTWLIFVGEIERACTGQAPMEECIKQVSLKLHGKEEDEDAQKN